MFRVQVNANKNAAEYIAGIYFLFSGTFQAYQVIKKYTMKPKEESASASSTQHRRFLLLSLIDVAKYLYVARILLSMLISELPH